MSDSHLLNQVCRLSHGRKLGYAEFGNPEGFPVVYCHGFPASRLEGGLIDLAAKNHGARLIAIDRPGYGLSDFHPQRRLLDWPDDVAQLLAHLGVGRFAVLAVSGGGPYGLALLAKLADRIAAASLVCPLGLVFRSDMTQAMRWPARFGFTSAQRTPWLTRLFYGNLLGPYMRRFPSLALSLLTVGMPPADRAIFAQEITKRLVCESIREALRPGVSGALWEFQIYSHPWGFDPAGITAPITLWHGEADATIPLFHSQSLADMMPNAKLHILPEEGHFSLALGQTDKILADLMRATA